MKNKYAKRSRISEAKIREIVRCFAVDLTATQTCQITGLNRNTVNRYFKALRQRLVWVCEEEFPLNGQVEVDESYFGAKRTKGKRGRGAYGKTIVFGIFKRNGKVYTEIVPDCSKKTLQAIIRGKVSSESVVHSDGWRGYNGLVDLGYGHFRVNHDVDEFVRDGVHINGIEGFWGLAKSRLGKFKGVSRAAFYLHLKECEFRYNYRNEDLYKIMIKLLRCFPLN